MELFKWKAFGCLYVSSGYPSIPEKVKKQKLEDKLISSILFLWFEHLHYHWKVIIVFPYYLYVSETWSRIKMIKKLNCTNLNFHLAGVQKLLVNVKRTFTLSYIFSVLSIIYLVIFFFLSSCEERLKEFSKQSIELS